MLYLIAALTIIIALACWSFATDFSGTIGVQTRFTYAEAFTGIADTTNPTSLNKQQTYDNGTGAEACDKVYAAQFSVAANTATVLTLSNGSLLDPLNKALSLVRVKAFTVQLLSTTDDSTNGTACNAVTMSGLNGTAGFIDGTTPKIRIFNGGYASMATPSAAGVATGLALNINNENTTTAAQVLLTVFGASA